MSLNLSYDEDDDDLPPPPSSSIIPVILQKSNSSDNSQQDTVGPIAFHKATNAQDRGAWFINIVTRFTLLTAVAVISTTILLFANVALELTYLLLGNHHVEYATQIFAYYVCLIPLEAVINVMCVWLNFGLDTHYYPKICGYAHRFCMRIYIL